MILLPQPDLSRQSSNADSWGRYYTSDWISQSLIGVMQTNEPRVIVELGSGRGALAAAAGEKWQYAEIVTVDVDNAATTFLNQLADRKFGAHKHYMQDALDENLANQIGLKFGSIDVAICNPPYVRPRWRTSFGYILEDAGLSGTLKSVHDAGADLLFIAQNLRLLKQYGKLGLILPDGLITSERFIGVRRKLMSEHLVEQVIQLPRRVFAGTEAQTYLVVLAKMGGETNAVTLRQLGIDGLLSPPLLISADIAQRRLDYSYHSSSTQNQSSNCKKKFNQKIRDIVLGVTRGSISSHQISGCNWPVFHLSDFVLGNVKVPKQFRISQHEMKAMPERMKIALPGDILVARIGRNLHEKIAIVEHSPCIVSDCVFILRIAPENRQMLLNFLTSAHGRQTLEATSHGVGARYLSSSDLLNMEVTG